MIRIALLLITIYAMTLRLSSAEEPRENQIKKSKLYYNALVNQGWRNPDSVKIMDDLIKENRDWNQVFQAHSLNENPEGDYIPMWWMNSSSPSIRASAELALAFLIFQDKAPDITRIQKLAHDIANCPKGVIASSPELRGNEPKWVDLVSADPKITILPLLAEAQNKNGIKSQAIATNERIILNYPDDGSCYSETDICWEYSCEAIQRIRAMGPSSALPALKRLLPKIKAKSVAHNCAMFGIAEIYDIDLKDKANALKSYRAFLKVFPGPGSECCSSTEGHGSQAKMRIEKLEQEIQPQKP